MIKQLLGMLGYEKKSSLFRLPGVQPYFEFLGKGTKQNYEKYMRQYADVSYVYSCINIIATKAASIKFKLYRKNKIKGQIVLDEVMEHPVLSLLETANPFMTGYDLMEATFTFLELTGNAYWLLDEFINGKPTKIYPLNPARVKIKPHKTEYVSHYLYDVGVGIDPIPLPKEQVIHFKYFNPQDDHYGLSPLSAGRLAIETQTFADKYNVSFFQNSADPRGVIETDKPMGDKSIKRLHTEWKALHQGVNNWHKIAIIEGGSWKSTGITQKDMDFINSKKMSREEVLTVLGVQPVLVGILDHASYANAREQVQIFWRNTEMPKLAKFGNNINSFLVTPYDENLVLLPDYTGIEALKEDEKLKAETDTILTKAGIKTINECRKERKLEPVAWGDDWNAPVNLIPISEPRIPEPVEPEPEEPEEDDDEKTWETLADDFLKNTKAKFKCECIECGKKVSSDKHCKDIKCPECGGEMRREERPGPGRSAKDETEEEVKARKARDKIWGVFKLSTEQWERKFKPILRSLFTKQEREVINNLRESGWKDFTGNIQLKREQAILKSKIDVILFGEKEALAGFAKAGKPIISGSLEDKAKSEIARLSLGIEFDIDNPALQKWVNAHTSVYSKNVGKTTEDALRRELKASLEAGESVKEAEKRIERVYDMARGYRTERIARTEIITASNKGAIESYQQSGIVEKKEWISSRDGLVRDSHQIDGKTVGLNDAFPNGLMYPGDPAGGADEICNCRCTLSAVVERGNT